MVTVRRKGSRHTFRTVVASVMTVGAMISLSGNAFASNHPQNYCGIPLNPHTWCTTGEFHTYSSNIAHYHGSGNVAVCSKFRDKYGYEGYRVCANRQAVSALGYQNSSFYIKALVANSSNYRHTIWGHGYFGGVY